LIHAYSRAQAIADGVLIDVSAKCNTYWGVLLHHLRQYVETGTPRPAFE
jgi:hypothetical protein